MIQSIQAGSNRIKLIRSDTETDGKENQDRPFPDSPFHTFMLPVRTIYKQTDSTRIKTGHAHYQVTCQLLISAPLNKNTP